MEEILLIADKVKNTLILGESHFREFKTALEGKPDNKKPRLVKSICADIGEALVSFANADGGEVLIGVEDDATITGVLHNEADIQTMLNAVTTHVYQNRNYQLQ
jgi:ATP-dependent DNA helicase RecG